MRYKSFTATVNWDGIPVENIPVLVRLSDGNPVGFIHREVKACGFEVLDEDGHMLPYEIDTWDPSGESLIWVLVRDYRDGATFTVRYGSSFANAPLPSTDVWAGYAGVWHLNDTNSASAYGTYPNSTAAAGIDGENDQLRRRQSPHRRRHADRRRRRPSARRRCKRLRRPPNRHVRRRARMRVARSGYRQWRIGRSEIIPRLLEGF
jgi:hypothetical protein